MQQISELILIMTHREENKTANEHMYMILTYKQNNKHKIIWENKRNIIFYLAKKMKM